jgi:hypothetical protein
MSEEPRSVAATPNVLPAGLRKGAAQASAPRAQARLVEARVNLAGEDRRRLIAEAAYFRAEQRGFAPGQELEDWLAAEIEIDTLLDADDGRA